MIGPGAPIVTVEDGDRADATPQFTGVACARRTVVDRRGRPMSGQTHAAAPIAATPKRARFLSLDLFRGLTIFLMILVNTAGPGAQAYAQLTHAAWFGFTLADLVFPSFLFAVGSAMSFALAIDTPHRQFLGRVSKRAALIVLCGVLMYWFPFFHLQPGGGWVFTAIDQIRLPGVLQRIGLCYLLAALLVRYLPPRGIAPACVALLLGYWAALYVFGQSGAELSKAGNAGTRLDLWLFGRAHLYRKDGGFDPEGLLGTLSATVNVLAGYLAGRFLQRRGKTGAATRVAAGRRGAGAAGAALAPRLAAVEEALERVVRRLHRGAGSAGVERAGLSAGAARLGRR